MNDTTKLVIHNLRYGYTDIKELTNKNIVNIMDYYLPEDVMQLCVDEIARRRKENLLDKKY